MHQATAPHTSPLDNDDIASLERATLDAVAPPEVQEIEGWMLPMDRSTVGRAKSAVPLRHLGVHESHLQSIETAYLNWGIPCTYRLADVPGLDHIHARLRTMGYAPEQPTLVMRGTVAAVLALPLPGRTQEDAIVDTHPNAAWAAVYTAPGFDPIDGAHRVQALSRSAHLIYAAVHRSGQPVAAGTAALSQGWASIHGMRTVLNARGQGLASQILHSLAQVAAQRGLERMFLQVEEDNPSAHALYTRAGFHTIWRYHYWRKT